MLSNLFLGMSLVGAEWVLYVLILLSIFSVSVIIERARFYCASRRGLDEFRKGVRRTIEAGQWDEALKLAESRKTAQKGRPQDLDTEMVIALIKHTGGKKGGHSSEALSEVAQDAVLRARLHWDRNLSALATIGNNAPFIGLFGTVLGIIKAFHDLSQQVATGARTVTAGISEALIATAVGILVALPAVVAFNLYQRKVKAAATEAEALKSFLVGKLAE